MTGAAIARKFGVATKTVTNDWFKQGCPRDADGGFDFDKVLAWRKAKMQEAMDDPAVKQQMNRTAVDLKLKLIKIQRTEFELAVLQRQYIHVDDARREVARVVYAVKSTLLAIPASLAATVVGLSPVQAETELRTAITRALQQLWENEWPPPPDKS